MAFLSSRKVGIQALEGYEVSPGTLPYLILLLSQFAKRRFNDIDVNWKKVCKELGIEGINLYQGTKHSLASQAANRGISEAIIGKMLRHKDPKSTKQYAHYRTSTLRLIWSTKKKTEGEKVENV
jgi:hypothetical protein